MCKKAISFVLITMFLFSATLESHNMLEVLAVQTLYVPTQYSTIQAAINAANPRDTIQVASGLYNEHIVINKSVSLIGQSPADTIIDGSGTGNNTVNIRANNVWIEGFTIQKGDNPFNTASLTMSRSKGNTIQNNVIRQSAYGIELRFSNSSLIVNNVIANNTDSGIYLSNSNDNVIIGNLLIANSNGAVIQSEATIPNTFYHNNFINNLNQASEFTTTKWNNGAEGNYWSDYNGQDLNGDGIGDTNIPHYFTFGSDSYPLMEEWSETKDFPTMWNGATYHTVISKNSTIASFNFTYSLAQISFNVTGPAGTMSFCNVTIEKSFLDGTFTVLMDGTPKNYDFRQNVTHLALYFTISHSVRKIRIRGTKVVGNMIPTADFTYSPIAPKESQEIQFTDASTDPDGTVTVWLWNFDDGNTSSLQNPVNKYMIKGSYNVTLTVTDDNNATNTVTKTIVVASFALDYTLYYVLIGIVAGAVILVIALFLFRQKRKQ